MAWELLTGVYQLPASHLYVTYFAGCEELGLDADLECRDIWRSIGFVRFSQLHYCTIYIHQNIYFVSASYEGECCQNFLIFVMRA